MKNDFKIVTLSNSFYKKYCSDRFPEILKKKTRPYNCLLTKSEKGYYICIPYRSSIRHSDSFLFYKDNSNKPYAGLDYTKIIILKDLDYVDNENVLIKTDHYKKTNLHIKRICKDANEYVENYKKYLEGEIEFDIREFERKYRYSTLKYFHDELGIKKETSSPLES